MTTEKTEAHQKFLELARQDEGIAIAYLLDIPLADMHLDWIRSVQSNQMNVIVAPRLHAKTTVMAVAKPCVAIGKNKNTRIKITSCNEVKAKTITRAIHQTILHNPRFKELYPNIELVNDRISTREIWVKRDSKYSSLRDPTVESIGIQSSAEGGRADLLICDDCVSRRNVATDGTRNMIKEAFYNTHLNALEPDEEARLVYVATIWHSEDLTSELLKSPEFKPLVYAIDDDFTPLWPWKWSREKLQKRCRTIRERRFNMQFRNRPYTDEDYDIPEDVFLRCIDSSLSWEAIQDVALKYINEGIWKTGISVDLAIEPVSRKACYTVVFVGAITPSGIRIPIDISRERITSPATARLIYDKYQRYKADFVIVETNGYQRALIDWMSELRKLPFYAIRTGIEKHDDIVGVKSLGLEFESNMWRVPKVSHSQECDCPYCAWKKEIINYPHASHDDCVMATWFFREGVKRFLEKGSSGSFEVWNT